MHLQTQMNAIKCKYFEAVCTEFPADHRSTMVAKPYYGSVRMFLPSRNSWGEEVESHCVDRGNFVPSLLGAGYVRLLSLLRDFLNIIY